MSFFTEAMKCPITGDIIEDPVMDFEGNTYEKVAILRWLQNHNTSPVTRSILRTDQLIPNRALKDSIEEATRLESLRLGESPSEEVRASPVRCEQCD